VCGEKRERETKKRQCPLFGDALAVGTRGMPRSKRLGMKDKRQAVRWVGSEKEGGTHHGGLGAPTGAKGGGSHAQRSDDVGSPRPALSLAVSLLHRLGRPPALTLSIHIHTSSAGDPHSHTHARTHATLTSAPQSAALSSKSTK